QAGWVPFRGLTCGTLLPNLETERRLSWRELPCHEFSRPEPTLSTAPAATARATTAQSMPQRRALRTAPLPCYHAQHTRVWKRTSTGGTKSRRPLTPRVRHSRTSAIRSPLVVHKHMLNSNFGHRTL